jgi:hypothetical protein
LKENLCETRLIPSKPRSSSNRPPSVRIFIDAKLLAEVRGTALSIISDQIRIDAAALQASAIRHGGPMAAELAQEEQRLLDLAFSGLGVRRGQIIEVPANGDDISPASEGEGL